MRAKKCDRCGKLFEYYDGSKKFKNTEKANGFMLIDRDLDNKYWSRKDYDLCPECMTKLEKFLKGELLLKDCLESDFLVSFKPGEMVGTMEIGGNSLKVYLGNIEGHHCGYPSGSTLKHKITVIEM